MVCQTTENRSDKVVAISFKIPSHFLDCPSILAQNEGDKIGIQRAELVRLVPGEGWAFDNGP